MASNSQSPKNRYIYFDDRQDVWYVELTQAVAEAGGFTLAPPPAVISLPRWPYPHTWLRHVRLVSIDDNGKRKGSYIPVPSRTNGMYAGTVKQVNLNGVGWAVVSRNGEISDYTGPTIVSDLGAV